MRKKPRLNLNLMVELKKKQNKIHLKNLSENGLSKMMIGLIIGETELRL